MARTVGLPTAWNRLLNFHMVRSTKAVVYTPANFVQSPCDSALRSAEHLLHNPGFPDPLYYLNFLGKYFFRNTRLRHLRIEQFNRYCMLVDATSAATANLTSENTVDDEDPVDGYRVVDANHRNYDRFLEGVAAGTRFPATMQGVPGARRRHDARLGVSRMPLLEMCGAGRENYYQQRLLTSLAWWCPGPALPVTVNGKEALQWSFVWTPPSPEELGGAKLEPVKMKICTGQEMGFSFEEYCVRLEKIFADPDLSAVCACCAGWAASSGKCESCRCATGWHHCRSNERWHGDMLWRAGSLHAGHLDVQRCLFNLHRRRSGRIKHFNRQSSPPPNISLRFLELTPAAADHCA